jgi:hypothetical protein
MAGGQDLIQPPPVLPPQEPPVQQQIQQPVLPLQATQNPIRLRRTHKDDLISSLLSKLSLREKLATNKDIEEKNKHCWQVTILLHVKSVRNYLVPVRILHKKFIKIQ